MSKGKIEVFRAISYGYRFGVQRMEVDRVTDKSVWFDGRRAARETEGRMIFDDFQSAKDWLVEQSLRKMEAANRKHEEASAALKIAQGITQGEIKTVTERW